MTKLFLLMSRLAAGSPCRNYCMPEDKTDPDRQRRAYARKQRRDHTRNLNAAKALANQYKGWCAG